MSFTCGNVCSNSVVGHGASVFVGGSVNGVSVRNGVVMGGCSGGVKLDPGRINIVGDVTAPVSVEDNFSFGSSARFTINKERKMYCSDGLTFFRVKKARGAAAEGQTKHELVDIVSAGSTCRIVINGVVQQEGSYVSAEDAKKLYNPKFKWVRSVVLEKGVIFRNPVLGGAGNIKIKADNVVAGTLRKCGSGAFVIGARQPALKNVDSSGSGNITISATCMTLRRISRSGSGNVKLKADQPKLGKLSFSGSGNVKTKTILGTHVRLMGSGDVTIKKITATPHGTVDHCGVGTVKICGGRVRLPRGKGAFIKLKGSAKQV